MKRAICALLLLLFVGVTQAAVIGEVESSTGRIDLMDEAGPCVDGARAAAYVPRHGKTIPGCWVAGGSVVFVVFFDGDTARVPVSAVRPPKTL